MSHHKPTFTVTPEQIAFFRDNGFLAIDCITTPEEVEMMRAAYDRIFSECAGRERGDQFDLTGSDKEGEVAALPQILNPSRYAPELAGTLAEANAQAIASQLLGAEAAGGPAHAIFKPAGYGAATPWHQDEAYWNPDFDYVSLSVWVPLQEATPENGCMQFVPGSHQTEVAPHQPIGNDPRVHGLELTPESGVDVSGAAVCPLPPGGATFHLSRTLHHTGANKSDVARRALIFGFSLPPTPRTDGRRFPWQEMQKTARQQRAKSEQS
jgi:ectoine hydroxylase-related dioxygenase (phytanoyl-CoA dioxygenase family)